MITIECHSLTIRHWPSVVGLAWLLAWGTALTAEVKPAPVIKEARENMPASSPATAAAQPEVGPGGNSVDFAYAFAPPHRITVCQPESGDKTLLDVEPGNLTMSWSYDKLIHFPPNIWKAPKVEWKLQLTPRIDDKVFPTSRWQRAEGSLPVLVNCYEAPSGRCLLEVAGGATAAMVRVTVANTSPERRRFSLVCDLRAGGWVISNPAWIDPTNNPDTMLAMEQDRADRVLMLGLGADEYPVGRRTVTLAWNLPPGQTRTGWVIRPYAAYEANLPELRAWDWEKEDKSARSEWRSLLQGAMRLQLPDPKVEQAFYACLADIFVMREPLAQGYMSVVPGTEVYRSPNAFEPCLAAILLDQVGLHAAAANGLRVHLDSQEPDGEWADRKGWCHHMWGASGMKAWAAMEHYHLTGDRDFLARVYPRLAASSRWQEKQRTRMRVMENGRRPVTYGLMPRGMGDGGLMNGDDYFGIFYPHNFLAVYADQLSVEAAQILGQTNDLPELRQILQTARADLLESLDQGAIREADYRWIPGTPNQTSGSVWGALLSLYPCGILPPDHPLIEGTLRHIEKRISPGGHPIGTGWMLDGCWVAITLDNVAEAHLARGEADAASRYLYPTLNHGTPLFTWCEERGVEPGTTKTSGDRQHLWTPLAVCRFLRDALVMEQNGGLQLALGAPRHWLASGKPFGINDAPSHFGTLSYSMRYDRQTRRLKGTVRFPEQSAMKWAALYLPLPSGLKLALVQADSGARLAPAGDRLLWENPSGPQRFELRHE